MFKWLEKLINERGSAAIMEKRLAMKDDEIAQLQAKIRGIEAFHAKEQIEADEVRIHRSGIEFRRGRRTSGTWLPFCPKCHMPATESRPHEVLSCSGRCGWVSAGWLIQLPEMLREIDPAA
jgi:hypothetical protein